MFTGPLHEISLYLQDLTGLELDKESGSFKPAKDPKSKPKYDGRKINTAIETMADPMLTHVSDRPPL
jgi:hypothetical protein